MARAVAQASVSDALTANRGKQKKTTTKKHKQQGQHLSARKQESAGVMRWGRAERAGNGTAQRLQEGKERQYQLAIARVALALIRTVAASATLHDAHAERENCYCCRC